MKSKQPQGFALLLNVLVLGIVSVTAAAILARGSLDGFMDSQQALSAWSTRAKVFGCLDEAIIQLDKNNDFADATVFMGSATCTLTVTTPAAGQRFVVVSLTEAEITRQVTALVTLDPFAVDQITEP